MNELWRIFIIYYYDVTNKIRCHDDLWNKVTNDLDAVHPYESAHIIPVTIPRVQFRFGPSAQTLKWAW